MSDKEHLKNWRRSGSFRIKLRGGVAKANVPRSSFVGIFGDEIRIIQGSAEKVGARWTFLVKEDSFGWDDFEIGEIIADGKVIFDGLSAFLDLSGGED